MALCLHEPVFQWATKKPDAVALVEETEHGSRTMTYGQLQAQALRIAAGLKQNGVKKGDLVAVRQPRGMEQVVCLFAILAVGAAYVPINVRHPANRVNTICQKGNIPFLMTEDDEGILDSLHLLRPSAWMEQEIELPLNEVVYDVDTLAYVIFTSGSTGEPKGVMISHGGAGNTIEDVNRRFGIGETDVGLQVSEIDFDLSVYDIFGILGAGGTLLLLDEQNRRDPQHWRKLVQRYGVTVWNSVPAIYEMLLLVSEHAKGTLPFRNILLSGDWIPLDFPARTKPICPSVRFVSLGGATEASIWSNFYEVKDVSPEWTSIPYGMPLHNQKLMVVDAQGNQVQPQQEGELQIGGEGVARGYLQEEALTTHAFYEKDGMRWYRTGDRAMEGTDGNYILLGRMDAQVKLHGYRIELGEIEHTMEQIPGVGQAVAVVGDGQELLAAYTARQTSFPSCNVFLLRDGDFHEEERERRTQYAARVMGDLMGLSEGTSRSLHDFAACNGAYQRWAEWLVEQGFATQEQDRLTATPKLWNLPAANPADYALLKDVLERNCVPAALLSSERYAPERLVLESKETAYYCTKILVPYLRDGMRVAVLDARTGLFAQQLCRLPISLTLTLFEESQGMLEEAKERLRGEPMVEGFVPYLDGRIEEAYEQQFDLVISANTLHTWKELPHALLVAEALLKPQGSLVALEYAKMDAMGWLTSALLEEGFTAAGQRRDPFRTVEEWQELLCQSPFAETELLCLEHTDALMIKAKKGVKQAPIEIESVLRERLPTYMIPQRFTKFLWYPLTENCKLDRNAIRNLLQTQCQPVLEMEWQGTAKTLWEIWQEYFGNHLTAPQKSFFELGGDSLLATRLLVRVQQEFGVELSLVELLEHSTVERMAAWIDEKKEQFGAMTEGEI